MSAEPNTNEEYEQKQITLQIPYDKLIELAKAAHKEELEAKAEIVNLLKVPSKKLFKAFARKGFAFWWYKNKYVPTIPNLHWASVSPTGFWPMYNEKIKQISEWAIIIRLRDTSRFMKLGKMAQIKMCDGNYTLYQEMHIMCRQIRLVNNPHAEENIGDMHAAPINPALEIIQFIIHTANERIICKRRY